MNKKKIIIIGGGSSALFLAALLDGTKYDIHLFEQKPSLGRKFLVAGNGGFNLTFHEPIHDMIEKYTPSSFMEPYINQFSGSKYRKWLNDIGIPTYVGTSNRIFPKRPIKPIEVLNAVLEQVKLNNVQIHTNTRWVDFIDDSLCFEVKGERIHEVANYYVWALGGGSWKKTGSDGLWLDKFSCNGIETVNFQASNCAFMVNWGKDWILANEGKAVKNISVSCNGKTKKGEFVLTSFGLEGNAIYPLSPQIRSELGKEKIARIYIDLKPMWSIEYILTKLNRISISKKRTNEIVRIMNFSKVQLSLLKTHTTKAIFHSNELLAHSIKTLEIEIVNMAPIDEAISTVGGIALKEVTKALMLKKMKNHYAIGEMLDYDAPTGGYLLQSCFSMASYLAHDLNSKY